MSKRPFVIFGILAAICLVVFPYVAITKEGAEGSSSDAIASRYDEGRELFQTNCGSCHTLAAAGTDGVVGPDLDFVLGTGTPEVNAGRVRVAVENGVQGRMPAGILEGEQAKIVADFVADNVEYVGQ